jgi:hypothetical protein
VIHRSLSIFWNSYGQATAIIPDGKTYTITTNVNEVSDFVNGNDGNRNLYYSVNPTRNAMTRKAAKTDIAAIEYFLADLDPKEDETPEAAKTRYLAALKTHKPTPTAIIDSGNGIQVLWKLAEPIQLEGDSSALIADVEGRVAANMLQLGSVAGTQNIDRILRLPGTTNLPNMKKLKAGRVPCPTSLIQFNGVTCTLDDFPPATTTKTTQHKQTKSTKPLPAILAALLYVKGSGDYPSRSELLFAFLNEALRKGVDESVIIDACLDEIYSGNGIFEHVKENGGEEYVQKQIAHALNEVPAAKSGQKLVIHCKKGDRHNINDRTQKALIAAKCPVFYYRGGVLVEPIWRWEKTGEDNHETLATSLVKLNPARLSYMTGKHAAIFQKYNVRDKRWEAIDPPKEMIEQLLDLGHWGFDTIKGIINSPTMRPDGSLLTVPGYDKATQLWYKSSGDIELPDIPERPTKEDALAALELLTKLLAGFLFKDDAGISLAVAIAGLMTPVLRGAFEFAPLFLILAPEPGSGKSYLVQSIGTLATGRSPVPVPMSENKEELEKRLSAVAFGAKPIWHFNNLDFDLESGTLNQIISEGIVELRPFGKNDQVITCDCRGTTIFVNGNNIRIVGDLVRRTLTTHLDTKMERPETRTFKFDPMDLIKADRGKYLAAVFTVVRGYMAAGCPKLEASPLAGFDSWTRMVRLPLMWLGMTDPVKSQEGARELDPDRSARRQRIDALVLAFGTNTFTAADIDTKAKELRRRADGAMVAEYPKLRDAFSRVDGKQINSKIIGNQLMKDVNRVSDGRKIQVSTDAHGNHYQITFEDEKKAKEAQAEYEARFGDDRPM